MRLLFLIIGLVFSSSVLAQDLGTDEQRAAGKLIYDEKCSQCHGMDGDGRGEGALFFRPEPRDFTSGIFKFRSSASGELPTDEDLRRSIRDGMPYQKTVSLKRTGSVAACFERQPFLFEKREHALPDIVNDAHHVDPL